MSILLHPTVLLVLFCYLHNIGHSAAQVAEESATEASTETTSHPVSFHTPTEETGETHGSHFWRFTPSPHSAQHTDEPPVQTPSPLVEAPSPATTILPTEGVQAFRQPSHEEQDPFQTRVTPEEHAAPTPTPTLPIGQEADTEHHHLAAHPTETEHEEAKKAPSLLNTTLAETTTTYAPPLHSTEPILVTAVQANIELIHDSTTQPPADLVLHTFSTQEDAHHGAVEVHEQSPTSEPTLAPHSTTESLPTPPHVETPPTNATADTGAVALSGTQETSEGARNTMVGSEAGPTNATGAEEPTVTPVIHSSQPEVTENATVPFDLQTMPAPSLSFSPHTDNTRGEGLTPPHDATEDFHGRAVVTEPPPTPPTVTVGELEPTTIANTEASLLPESRHKSDPEEEHGHMAETAAVNATSPSHEAEHREEASDKDVHVPSNKLFETVLSLRFPNIDYSPEFEDRESGAAKKLWGQVYPELNAILRRIIGDENYVGFRLLSIRNGSVVIDGQILTQNEPESESSNIASQLEEHLLGSGSQVGGNAVDAKAIRVNGMLPRGIVDRPQHSLSDTTTHTSYIIAGAVGIGLLIILFAMFSVVVLGVNSRRTRGTLKVLEEINMAERGHKAQDYTVSDNNDGVNLTSAQRMGNNDSTKQKAQNGNNKVGCGVPCISPMILNGSQFTPPSAGGKQ